LANEKLRKQENACYKELQDGCGLIGVTLVLRSKRDIHVSDASSTASRSRQRMLKHASWRTVS